MRPCCYPSLVGFNKLTTQRTTTSHFLNWSGPSQRSFSFNSC